MGKREESALARRSSGTHICLSSNLNTLMDSRFSLADVQQKLFIDSDYHFLMQQNVSEEAATSYTCYTSMLMKDFWVRSREMNELCPLACSYMMFNIIKGRWFIRNSFTKAKFKHVEFSFGLRWLHALNSTTCWVVKLIGRCQPVISRQQ